MESQEAAKDAILGELGDVLKQAATQQPRQSTDGNWVPYRGPRGGEGWYNPAADDVRYTERPPGEVAEGYREDFWDLHGDDDGYIGEEWTDALAGTIYTQPDRVPESARVTFETNTGATAEGTVVGFEYGGQYENYSDEPAYLIVDTGDATFNVGPGQVIDIEPPERAIPEDLDWETDVSEPPDDVPDPDEVAPEDIQAGDRITFTDASFGYKHEGIVDWVDEDDGLAQVQWTDRLDHSTVINIPDSVESVEATAGRGGPLHEEIDSGDYLLFVNRNGVREVGEFEFEFHEDGRQQVSLESDRTIDRAQIVAYAERGIPDDVLSDPFAHTEKVIDARDEGITAGQTTGDHLEILPMPDGSRVFVTPVEAYEHTSTGVVTGKDDAIKNNLNSPKVINHLGGNACETRLVDGPDGEYIAKEGIGGVLYKDIYSRYSGPDVDVDWDDNDELYESLVRTMAAAFFVGNKDLHGANYKLDLDANEAVIIDQDSAGQDWTDNWPDIRNFARGATDVDDLKARILDITRQYMNGDLDPPDDIGDRHRDYFQQAISKAQSDLKAHLFDQYESAPGEPIDGYDSLADFEAGMEVSVITDEGRVRRGPLTDFYRGTWYGQTEDNYEIQFDNPRDVLEVHSEDGGSAEWAPVEEYDSLSDFSPGERVMAYHRGETTVGIVDRYDEPTDDYGPRLVIRPEDDDQKHFAVHGMDEIVGPDNSDGEDT